MTTVAELYNEDDHTVNHHGFSRNVKEKDIGKVGVHQNPILNDKSEQSELYFMPPTNSPFNQLIHFSHWRALGRIAHYGLASCTRPFDLVLTLVVYQRFP